MMPTRVPPRIEKRIFDFLLVFSLFLLPMLTFGQAAPKRSLITQSIDETNLTLLKGNTYPLARTEFDRGVAPLSLPMQRMLLVLKRSPELEAALGTLLDEQQDKSSPNFHKWLTPEQFGQQFGPSDEDIQTVTGWLQSHGFQVAKVAKGRIVIEFSGTAAQVQEAFHTEIHKFTVNGEDHWANANDPQIPSALVPVVVGVNTLHNFPRKPMNHYAGLFRKSRATGEVKALKAQFSFGPGCSILGGLCAALGPYDFAAIYNLSPLWAAGIDGTGQTIAIVGETDINPQDVTDFRTIFNLPPPKLNIIHDGPAPGIQSDEPEANIDIQWSSAVAKNATIDFVVSASTDSSFGVDLSAEYIVDNNLAPVMSESYGECELGLGTAGNSFYNLLWQQAAAQGITAFVASGDQGSAVCDGGGSAAGFGLAVSGLSSTPFNIAVGGTDFNDLNNPSTYWNDTNDSNHASAKGYIPEMTWNDSCTNSEIFSFFSVTTAEQSCNNSSVQFDGFLDVVGGSGGKSNCTSSTNGNLATCSGGYPKPSWQTALTPADSKRDVPDLSLFASNGFNGSFYIICEADLTPDNTCNLNSPYFDFAGFGGTSVSSPALAGIMALINQKTGSRQGNANYVSYKLAAQPGASCTSTANPGPTCIFYDVPAGSTIAMPCLKGSKDCTTTNAGDQFGVLSGYPATAGYDLATGLGSVNASNLVTAWSSFASSLKASAITLGLTPSPVSITHGTAVNVNISVSATPPATGTPTGLVSLIASTGQGFADFTLSTNGSVSTTTNLLPGGNQYTVTAHYPGDGTFGPSDSAPTGTVTVSAEPSTTTVKVLTGNLFTIPLPFASGPYGIPVFLRADVAGQSGNGIPTGSVNLTDTLAGVTSNVPGDPYTLNAGGNTFTPNGIFTFAPGQHSIAATYGGDASFKASNNSAAPASFTITQAPTTITVSSAFPSYLIGNSATLIATFTSFSCGLPPAGTITFFTGTTSLGSVPMNLNVNSGNCTFSGPQILNTNALPLGQNTITAKYNGDTNYAASPLSPPTTVDVVIPTTCSISSSSLTIAHGSSVTFTYSVKPTQAGGPGPSGSILFTANTTIIGTVPLASGQAQVTTSALPGGNIDVVGNYNGDSNYTLCGAALVETVTLLPTTTTISSSNPSVQQGQSVTLTAHVAPVQAGGPALTGTVQFLSSFSLTGGDTPLGSAPLSNGQAQITTTALPANTQFVFASYSGDSNYVNSTGSAPQTVTPAPDFSIAANPQTIIVSSPGSSGSTTLTFTAMNGFSGTINLSPTACSGLPAQSSCSFSPSTVTLNSTTTTGMTTLTVSTMAPSNVAPHFVPPPTGITWLMMGIASVLALFFLLGASPLTRRWNAALALLAFAALLTFAACGGGGGPHNPGTPIGVDPNVVVSISGGGVAHNIQLTVNVQ